MNRDEYKSIAGRIDWHGTETSDGELTAGKSNGATYLDIGGECDVLVREPRDADGEVVVMFTAEDSTRGELRLPKEVLP